MLGSSGSWFHPQGVLRWSRPRLCGHAPPAVDATSISPRFIFVEVLTAAAPYATLRWL